MLVVKNLFNSLIPTSTKVETKILSLICGEFIIMNNALDLHSLFILKQKQVKIWYFTNENDRETKLAKYYNLCSYIISY